MQGILYALVPMFAWGSIGFVSNKIGGKPNQQTLGMTLGALLFAFVVWLFVRPEMSVSLWVFGIIGGMLWSMGQNGQFRAMQYMGVSVGNPLSSGAQLVFGSLIGAIVFGEWSKPIQYTLGIIALILLVIGFYFTSKRDSDNAETNGMTDFGKGFRALTYSTVGYLSYTILFNNIMKFDALAVIFPMSVGMVFSIFIASIGVHISARISQLTGMTLYLFSAAISFAVSRVGKNSIFSLPPFSVCQKQKSP